MGEFPLHSIIQLPDIGRSLAVHKYGELVLAARGYRKAQPAARSWPVKQSCHDDITNSANSSNHP
jgi:hypothetical protein